MAPIRCHAEGRTQRSKSGARPDCPRLWTSARAVGPSKREAGHLPPRGSPLRLSQVTPRATTPEGARGGPPLEVPPSPNQGREGVRRHPARGGTPPSPLRAIHTGGEASGTHRPAWTQVRPVSPGTTYPRERRPFAGLVRPGWGSAPRARQGPEPGHGQGTPSGVNRRPTQSRQNSLPSGSCMTM